LVAAGFHQIRQRGSHARYVNDAGWKVTVPRHSRDLSLPVIRSILKQAGLSDEEWELL